MLEIELTPSQAHYALSVLVRRHKVRISQIKSALAYSDTEIQELRDRLSELGDGDGSVRDGVSAGHKHLRVHESEPKTRRRVSPERKITLKLQGMYLVAIRGLNQKQRAEAKKIIAEKGKKAAIKFAHSLQKKAA